MVEKNIRNIFLEYPEVIYGFTNIAYSEYASTYKSALVFAIPYGEELTIETYSEKIYEHITMKTYPDDTWDYSKFAVFGICRLKKIKFEFYGG